MKDAFAESRASLRSLLGVSGTEPGATVEWAPRSRVMRAVLNPANRPVLLAVATLATLVFPRLSRAGAIYPLVSRVAKAGRQLAKMRIRR